MAYSTNSNVLVRFISLSIKDGNTVIYSKSTMERFMDYVISSPENLHEDLEDKNKAYFREIAGNREGYEGKDFYSIVLKSCRYNHSPDVMSRVTGEVEKNTRGRNKGDRELTHMCIQVRDNWALLIFELNQDGIGFSVVFDRFVELFKSFGERGRLVFEYMPDKDAIETIKTSRILAMEVDVDRSELGSDHGMLLKDECYVQETAYLTYRAKRKESISLDFLKSLLAKKEAKKIKRLRVHIKTKDDAERWVDYNKLFEKEYIKCQVDADGIPKTDELLKKMIAELKDHD